MQPRFFSLSSQKLATLGARPAALAAAVVVGLLVAATLALWAHYGTAVFYEMIAAGLASCF
jgi:hypothetical protein